MHCGKLAIASVDLLTDTLLSMAGNVPPGVSQAARTFGKAKDEAVKKGYSPGVQTAYALGKTLQEYFQTMTKGYGLNDNTPEEKHKLIAYMKPCKPFAYSSGNIVDCVTGRETNVPETLIKDKDGICYWSSSHLYYMEKYDFALDEEFIRYVMERP